MPEAPTTTAAVADFLRRWGASGAAERANYQLLLSELCDLQGVPRPALKTSLTPTSSSAVSPSATETALPMPYL